MFHILVFVTVLFFSCGVVEDDLSPTEGTFEFTRYYSNISAFSAGTTIQNFPGVRIRAPNVPSLSFRYEWLDAKPCKPADNWFSAFFRQPVNRSFYLGSTHLQIQMKDHVCNGNYRIWIIASADSLKDSVDFDFKISGGKACETVQPLDSTDYVWPFPQDGDDAYIQLSSRQLVVSSGAVSVSAPLSDFQMTYRENLGGYFLTHPSLLHKGWAPLLQPQDSVNGEFSDEAFNFFAVPPSLPLTTNMELYHISESIKSAVSNTSSRYVRLNPGETWLYRDKNTVLGIKVVQTGNRLVLRILSY